jgi:hypothetical protein
MRPSLLVAAAVIALSVPSVASAAAPNSILVGGSGITRPIVLRDWHENLVLMSSLVSAPRVHVDLRRRPKLVLAEFWRWSGRLRPTRLAQSNQRGWLYPAHGSEPAVILLTVGGTFVPRALPREARAILARHGVPLRR